MVTGFVRDMRPREQDGNSVTLSKFLKATVLMIMCGVSLLIALDFVKNSLSTSFRVYSGLAKEVRTLFLCLINDPY